MTNPLEEIIPAKYRQKVYAILALILLGIAAWQASEGNWVAFVALLAGTLSNGTAAANPHPEDGPE